MQEDIADVIGSTIARLAKRLTSASETGLSPAHASALAAIVARGSIRLSELTSFERLNPTMASRVVSALERRGLVRTLRDATDRRAAIVHATPEGVAVRACLRRERRAVVTEAFAALEASDRESIIAALPALDRLVSSLDAHSAA